MSQGRIKKHYYQDISTIVKLYTIAALFAVVIGASAVWMRLEEIEALKKIEFSGGFGAYAGPVYYTTGKIFAEIGLKVLSVLHYVVPYATFGLFLVWICLASKNARALSATSLICSPGWAAVWFLIPGLNLIVPFFVVKDLAKKSDSEFQTGFGLIILLMIWWGLSIVASVSGEIGIFKTFTADNTTKLIAAEQWLVWFHAIDIPATILSIAIVKIIQHRQLKSFSLQKRQSPIRPASAENAQGSGAADKLIFS